MPDAAVARHRAGMCGGNIASFQSVEYREGRGWPPGSARANRAACAAIAAALALLALAGAPARGQQGRPGLPDPASTPSPAVPPAPTPAQVPTGAVAVTVTLTDPRGSSQPAANAVVWIAGAQSGATGGEGVVAGRVAQRRKTFEPHVEVVRVGSTVAFPNLDRIYHNVFSLSEIAPFDLGLYRNGASRSLVFPRPGVVHIYCNIHPDMAAFLVVVDSDVFGKTAANGSLELRDVQAGTWPLSVWHETGGELETHVTVEAGRIARLALRLDATKFHPVQHKNKYGKDYPPPDDDENRY